MHSSMKIGQRASLNSGTKTGRQINEILTKLYLILRD